VLRHRYLVWQRRLLLAITAACLSFLINLLIPAITPAQQAILPPAAPFIYQSQIVSVLPKFQGNIIRQVKINSDKKVVALTFDDGPTSNITPQVLEILKQNKIKATFFLIGQNLKHFPKIAQQIVADGHTLGNHTWHHWRKLMMAFTASHELEDTAQLMYEVTGVQTSLFRPPNGFLHNGLVDYALKRKDAVVLWSLDSEDWRGSQTSVEKIVNRVVTGVKPGGIILMHDGGGDRSRTVQALPKIIEQLTNLGYKFVSVPELLEIQDLDSKAKPTV
jgi:peptidoglycan/xylan/chitin deacetylase (PgdA/CDA1 family)